MKFFKIFLIMLVGLNIFVQAAQSQVKNSFLSNLVHQTKIWKNKIFHVSDNSEEQIIEHSSRDIADHINKNIVSIQNSQLKNDIQQKNHMRDNLDLAFAELQINKAIQLSLPEENVSVQEQVIEEVQVQDESTKQSQLMKEQTQEKFLQPIEKQLSTLEELVIDLNQIEAGPDSECIIIFSQCNFKGANLKACDNLDELQSFHYKIQSIYIPDGIAVTLYNQANFQGDELNFTESQSCLENPIDLTGDEE